MSWIILRQADFSSSITSIELSVLDEQEVSEFVICHHHFVMKNIIYAADWLDIDTCSKGCIISYEHWQTPFVQNEIKFQNMQAMEKKVRGDAARLQDGIKALQEMRTELLADKGYFQPWLIRSNRFNSISTILRPSDVRNGEIKSKRFCLCCQYFTNTSSGQAANDISPL